MKILIVGGVAGGAGAAVRLRRLSEKDEIIMFEKTSYISYANCGLPYYIGDVIKEKEKILVQTVEGLSKRFNLDIRINNEVIKIDKDKKQVIVKDLINNKEYLENYDKLVIATGSEAIIPNIENINVVDNLFTLKNIPDMDKIYEYIKNNNVKKTTVIGAGFIGIEIAENLVNIGIDVTVIDFQNQILPATSDFEMAQHLHKELTSNGVQLIFNDLVTKLSKDGNKVITKQGNEIDTDMIIMSVGIKPTSKLLQNIDINLDDKTKAVIIDNDFKTSDNDIYAVGDVIMQKDMFDNNVLIPLAWGANRQARQLADSINGKKIIKDKINGANVIQVFDKTFASVGLTEKQAKLKKLDYDAIYINRLNHAGYYPNASNIILKLIFDKKTKEIYGCQGVGKDGVEKRIDIISTVMKFKGKVTDLSSIELCYAPPYNSAKDPVNILGYVAENIIDDMYKTVQYYEIDEIIEQGGYLLDVRTKKEYELGNIKGSHLLELDEIRNNIDKLPKDKSSNIYVTCKIGHRAYIAICILHNLGYTNLYNLTGGYDLYKLSKIKFEK